MFLPPVIAIKPSELESGISRFKLGTLDEVDIAKLWKSFASVRQYTVDPLLHACRLENFWWRVWGSKQKHLSGLELGRLCSHLYNERFDLSLCRQSDFTGEPSSQNTTTSYAESNDYEKAKFRLATKLPSEISLEYNPQPVSRKPIIPSSQGSRSDARFISPDKTEEGNSTAQSVPCIVLQPASINSCETKTEGKRIFGPAISKRRKKVLNTKKQPLVARRYGSHLSTGSARITEGRIRRRVLKPASKSDGVFVMNEKSNSKLVENNSKVLFAETRNASATPKLKSPDHIHYKMDSKKLESMSCVEDRKEGAFGDKMIKAGVSSVVRGLQDEVSRLDTDELAVQERMNCTLLTKYLKMSRSTSNKQVLTRLKNSHNDSDYQSAIPVTRDLNENITSKSDKIYNTSIKSPVVTCNTIKQESSNETEPRTIGSQMPINIFAKRPIHPKFSLSESMDKLSTSKSQLTLLIEKDRARIGENGSPAGK